MKEAKADVKGSSSRSTVPGASTSTGNADGAENGNNDAPIKVELAPQEAEIAAMLLIPESELPTPANEQNLTDVVMQGSPSAESTAVEPAAEPVQNVDMQEADAAPAVPPAEAAAEIPPATDNAAAAPAADAPAFNPALTNAEGEPLMAMMTDDADLPAMAGSSQDAADQQSSNANQTDAAPENPAEVVASSSSHRHRHGESSNTHARLQLLREKPAVVFRFLHLIVPVLFDVYSASVTLQVRMRCFTGILKATSFVDGVGMEMLYRVSHWNSIFESSDIDYSSRMSLLRASSGRF
jgi:hypothetical protein